jgi:RNA polymerase sigma factor (sigma-70 family)
MASLPFGTTFRRLLHRIDPQPAGDRTDGILLARFVAEQDETAFTALVARHGPMVLGVCRRVLSEPNDAEDAFQATFLVLSRKAASLDRTLPLGSWLYTVARNLAMKLRGREARRRSREKEASTMPQSSGRDELAWREVRTVLDDELGRLPEKYRAPLVLCHLQGMTHQDAAKELGWPAGSMAKRLARGQELLRHRLAGRGVTLSLAALLTLVAQRGTAAVSPALAQGIGKAAVQFVAGKPTASLASAAAVALAGHGLQSVSSLKIAAVLLLGVGILGTGAGVALVGQRADGPAAPAGRPAAPRQPAAIAKAEADEIEKANDQLRRKLAQPVNLDKGIDANTPLHDALAYFSEKYDLKIRLDEKAFVAHGVEKVGEQPIQLPKMVGVKLQVALGLILGQLPLDNGMLGGYRIKGGAIDIMPVEPSEPGQDWVSPKLKQRLLRPVAWDRDIPDDMTFTKMLELVGGRYGEKLIIDDKSFTALGGVSPRDGLAAPFKLNGGRESLLTLLDFYLLQCQGRDFVAVYRVKPQAIEIVAVKRDSAELRAVSRAMEPIRERQEADRRIAAYARKLEKVSAEEIFIDPNTPLKDALEFLSDKFDLSLIIDTKAFETAGVGKADEAEVQLPRRKNAKVGDIIQALLDQVQVGDWIGSMIVREDYVEIAPVHKHIKEKKPLTKKQLDDFWEELASSYWIRTVMTAQTLAQFPDQSVGLLRERVRPATPPDAKKTAEAARWVKDLDSEEFAVREKATEELEKLGKDAIPVLRDQLKAKPSFEVRQRVERLLEKVDPPISREQLRQVRAIHLLEQLGTPDAERLLEALAQGARGTVTTEKARTALARLKN